MFRRFNTIPACDRQTDRRTSCHGIVRAYAEHRAVKTRKFHSSLTGITAKKRERESLFIHSKQFIILLVGISEQNLDSIQRVQ